MSLLSFPSGQGRRKEKSPSELALARQQGSSGQGTTTVVKRLSERMNECQEEAGGFPNPSQQAG